MKRNGLLLLALGLALAAPPAARADGDAFGFYSEESQVVTAERRAEPAWRAPVAVDVVTADDIRAYGYRDIWDVLRYRAGMDVIDGRSADGNRALVSARGFDNEFVSELQVLVDGRSVYSPFLGGVYWQDLPVQMQDIERIEIVRGPNAALYGSNAALGVINIITKKPGGSSSAQASAYGGSQDAYDAAAAGEAGSASAGLRVSGETRADEGSPSSTGGRADDFLHLNKLNLHGRWNPDPKTEIELLSGASWMTAGLPGLATGGAEAQHMQNFESLKATRSLGSAGALEFSASRAEAEIESTPLFAGNVEVRTYQYDAELLHRFSWLDERVHSSWGVDGRDSGADSNQAFMNDPRQNSRLVRVFTHHSASVAEPLTVVGGVSLEHSGTGGTQFAGQAAALYSPNDANVLRVSYSLAPTIPAQLTKNGDFLLAPGTTYTGNPSFSAERFTSWETGWSGRLLDGTLRPAVSLYYMDVGDLAHLTALPGGPPTTLTTNNSDHALARGAEASVEWTVSTGRAIFANYTFERITNSLGPSATGEDVTRSTPEHMFNVGARAALVRDVEASLVLGYKDAYLANSDSRGVAASIEPAMRLDARLGWKPRPNLELFVAGQNLLQPYTVEYVDGLGNPRTVRGGMEMKF
jgi:iron complex outermembrane receptor protein